MTVGLCILSPHPVLQDVDKWSFDVFSLNEASGDHALKFIFYELLTRYDLISRFKVSTSLKRKINELRAYVYPHMTSGFSLF